MKRKLITSIVLAGMFAFGVHAETFVGSLTIDDAVIAPGGTTTLSVQLENNIPVRGFQFVMYLPEGVTVVDCTMNEDRFPEGKTLLGEYALQEDGGYIFPYTIQQKETFLGTSGELASIRIKADESVAEGEYKVELKDIYCFNISDAAPMYSKEKDEFTLTVSVPTYTDGYAVSVLPFAFKEDVECPFVLDNMTNITNLAFDLELPSVIAGNSGLYSIEKVYPIRNQFNLNSKKNSDGTIHITVDQRSSSYQFTAGTANEVAILSLIYDGVPEGVYPISIANIQMTDAEGFTYLAAPYTTEIFVGNDPKATVTDGLAAFHGNYGGAGEYALLTAALPEGATIDLTEVSDMAGDPTTLRINNVFVTADAVAYGRDVTSEWGSLCLPFDIETDDNIQLYEMTGTSGNGLIFDKVSSAAANTPLIFRTAGNGFTLKVTNDGSFNAGYAARNPTVTIIPGVDQWEINGSFIDESIDVSSMQAYALSGGQFHRVNSKLNVKAFHAWLQNKGTAQGAAIRIEESTNGIDIIEQEDGSIKLIFDLQGRLLKNGERQQMHIENGKKVISINN